MQKIYSPEKKVFVFSFLKSLLGFRENKKRKKVNEELLKLKYTQLSLIFLVLSVFLHLNSSAQSCANYSVSRTTSITYSSISGSSPSHFTWRNTSSNQNDDNRSFQVPIGFDFWYLGVRYTAISATLNGAVDFSASTSDGNLPSGSSAYGSHWSNQFSSGGASGTMLALAPLYGDLWTGNGGTNPIATSLVYLLSGSAPNRVLTVEWINFDHWNSPTNSPYASYNFQVKIHESTGIIDFIYGTMNGVAGGSYPLQYACGINNTWAAGAPTTAQMLTQQTANTTTFNNTAKNNLTTVPTANSQLSFTPPTPSAAPTGISFTSIGKTGMTVNWTDNANNEVAYAIYSSTDNINFTFAAQAAANSTSAAVTGLTSGTTYYWQVYAVTEGKYGTALTGTQATLAGSNITSNATGVWSATGTWVGGVVPVAGDNVTIANSHTVTLDVSTSCGSLTVGQGTSGQLTIGSSAAGLTLTMANDITVNAGATITTGATAATHAITTTGNIINNGTINLAPTGTRICNVTFTKNGNQSISGSGATSTFNNITVNMGSSSSNILTVSATNFSAASNFLTLTNGTFYLTAPVTITPFTSANNIVATCGLRVNNSSAIINITGGTLTVYGYIQATAGTINVGNASDQNLTSYGGNVTVDGGTINVAGRLDRTGPTVLVNLTISSGTLKLAATGSTTAAMAPFHMDEVGSTFNMSGGTIIIVRPGAGNLGFYNIGGTLGSVTGGILQIGNASTPAAQTIQINSISSVGGLVVSNGVAVTAQLVTNPLTVVNDVTINSGTLNSSSLNLTIGGNWSNSGTFTAGTGTVKFNGGAQSLTGNATSFYNLTFAGSGTKTLTTANCTVTNILSMEGTATTLAAPTYGAAATLQYNKTVSATAGPEWITPFVATGGVKNINSGTITIPSNVTVTSSLTLTGGMVAIGANTLTLNGNFTGTSAFALQGNGSSSNLTISGSGAIGTIYFDQTTSGTTNAILNLVINRTGQTITLGNNLQVINAVTPTAGTLASAGFLSLISNASGTARIDAITAGSDVAGNVTVQRYFPPITRRYRTLSSPVQNFTLAQLQSSMFVTGTGGATNGFDATPSNTSTCYTFQEATTGSGRGWKSATAITNAVATTVGMLVFVRGDRTLSSPAWYTGPTYTAQNEVTINFTNQPINKGSYSSTLTYTNTGDPTSDGFNLIGNPYPCQIDWSLLTKSNLSAFFYVYDPSSGSYVSANTGVIASGQGFMVQATAASPSLTFTESAKTSSTAAYYFKSAPQRIQVKMIKDSLNSDVAWLDFNSLSSKKFDANEDAMKMFNSVVNIGFYIDSVVTTQFNSVPMTSVADTFVMSAYGSAATYTLKFSDIQAALPSSKNIYLLDLFTSNLVNLRVTDSVTFAITSNPASSGNRFQLIIVDPSLLPVKWLSFTGEKSNRTDALLKWQTANEKNNSHFVIERATPGQSFTEIGIVNSIGNNSTTSGYNFLDKNIFNDLTATVIYRLKQVDKDGRTDYSQVITLRNEAVNDATQVQVYPNPVNDLVNVKLPSNMVGNVTVDILDITGKTLSTSVIAASKTATSLSAESIRSGIYFLRITDEQNTTATVKFVKE
ncbi:MAG: beta strand repeat-containing protein [Bacteroidia bacterium]